MIKSIAFNPEIATREVAQLIFGFLKIQDFEERESSNYPPEGGYFKGVNGDIVVSVYAIDDSEISSHCLSVRSSKTIDMNFIDGLIQYLAQMNWRPRAD